MGEDSIAGNTLAALRSFNSRLGVWIRAPTRYGATNGVWSATTPAARYPCELCPIRWLPCSIAAAARSRTQSASLQRRALLLPQEVKALGREQAIAFYEGLQPPAAGSKRTGAPHWRVVRIG